MSSWTLSKLRANSTCYISYINNVGGLIIVKCNYAMKNISNNSVFYRELLEWWLEFRNLCLADKERLCIIWNNKDIRIDEKPVFNIILS